MRFVLRITYVLECGTTPRACPRTLTRACVR